MGGVEAMFEFQKKVGWAETRVDLLQHPSVFLGPLQSLYWLLCLLHTHRRTLRVVNQPVVGLHCSSSRTSTSGP